MENSPEAQGAAKTPFQLRLLIKEVARRTRGSLPETFGW